MDQWPANLDASKSSQLELGEAVLAYLKWSEAFNKTDLPNHIPHLGWFTLIVDPIIVKSRLSCVLMDGGLGVNLLYVETNDAMCLSRVAIRPSDALFHGVILGLQSIPLGKVDLPMTFIGRENFCKETLTFKNSKFPRHYPHHIGSATQYQVHGHP